MICNYSRSVWQILIGMVVTGAARSVAVKLAYQCGFTAPLTMTLLYLFGQALSLLVYFVQTSNIVRDGLNNSSKKSSEASSTCEYEENNDAVKWCDFEKPYSAEEIEAARRAELEDKIIGSLHGLNEDSEKATAEWIQKYIPKYVKPVIPALFNMANSALRWASLLFVAASIAEMMISGLELVLSVLAGRLFRKRIISNERWVGVGLVTIGITVVGLVDYINAADDDAEGGIAGGSKSDVIIGIALIICQSILSVLQDISEEIFMQVKGSEFPATLMLGIEGSIGFSIGIVIYFTCGKNLGEDPEETLSLLSENNRSHVWWVVGMPILFLVTGVFNICATEVTSSITRNIWKNLRTVLVWVFALLIFYSTSDSSRSSSGIEYNDIGEEWIVPDSLYILLGFAIMTFGIVVYYTRNNSSEEKKTNTDKSNDELHDVSTSIRSRAKIADSSGIMMKE